MRFIIIFFLFLLLGGALCTQFGNAQQIPIPLNGISQFTGHGDTLEQVIMYHTHISNEAAAAIVAAAGSP
jgi:hypothetical protein